VVKLGRRIFDNLKKAIAFIFSVHVPIAGMSLIPVLFSMPLILLPVHIAFLQLIIDPACSTVFEAEREEKNVMNRPPRRKDEGLFTRRTLTLSLLQGFVVLAIVLTIYVNALSRGIGENEVRAMTFTTIVIADLSLILTNRSWSETIVANLLSPNTALVYVFLGTVISLALVLYVPFLQDLFRFGALSFADLALCAIAGILSILWFELFKLWGLSTPGKTTG
jgi:Ca2+-transporting ATPase